MEGLLGNGDGYRELVGRKQPEHGGDGLLHGVSGVVRDTFGDDGVVEGLDASQHVGDDGESPVEAGLACRYDVVRGEEPVHAAGDQAACDGGGGSEAAVAAEEEGRRRERERERVE